MTAPINPPPLEHGDRIALVAPSDPIDDERLEIARDRLRDVFDLEPVVFDTAKRDSEWLEANPEVRAEDLMKAFEDDSIQGVMAVTGGDDQLRILPYLDPDRITETPKRFFGYSDNDNFRLLLWNHGIVSYGAVCMPTLAVDRQIHPYTERYLRRAFFEERVGEIQPAKEWSDGWYDFDTREPRKWHENDGWDWRGDRGVSGRLWGGCFSILNWQLQTDRYLPASGALDGAVLALETSEDIPYAQDVGYLLRSLGERGWLQRFSGVMVGRPRTFAPHVDREIGFEEYRKRLHDEIAKQLDRYNPNATAVFNVDFGHTDPLVPIPIGSEVRLVPRGERIVFE
ncbi:MAG: LD-carboxypeptidase [Euryarchaeota archaeon]|nr:LD-carboxypeptidase [Euryarchaeota archaeon]